MDNSPARLYDICLIAAVRNSASVCTFCKKDYHCLPDNVLFDFCYTLFLEKRPCLLAVELSSLEVFSRLLRVNNKNQRMKLLKCFQGLINHETNTPEELITGYSTLAADANPDVAINIGIRIGSFFNEGGWYQYTIEILSITEKVCLRQPETIPVLKKCLHCYHVRLYAETVYCDFKAAATTFDSAQIVIKKLENLNALPNLAGLYANFSSLFFYRSEYDKAFDWSKTSLKLLEEKLPLRMTIEVLRQASRACVVKRRFTQAGLLITQAVNLAQEVYEIDSHPHFSDTLLDYGFYLLNFDSIQESVKVYKRSLNIRKDVFDKNNIHLALAHEDMAYALYVNEYSSGRFYNARENADRAIRLMERILPGDNLMLASANRVKALILEEIALDMRDVNDSNLQEQFLIQAEELHRTALKLSLRAFGEKNVQTAKHYGNLGRLYQSMRKYSDAEKMHLKAIAIKEELLGSEDYEVGLSIGHLASLYNYHMKRHHDAEKLYMRSMEINLNLFGESYSGLEYDYRGLINVYSKLADHSNVIFYNLKMRDWSIKRTEPRPVTHKEDIMPLNQLIERFFQMIV